MIIRKIMCSMNLHSNVHFIFENIEHRVCKFCGNIEFRTSSKWHECTNGMKTSTLLVKIHSAIGHNSRGELDSSLYDYTEFSKEFFDKVFFEMWKKNVYELTYHTIDLMDMYTSSKWKIPARKYTEIIKSLKYWAPDRGFTLTEDRDKLLIGIVLPENHEQTSM